MLSHNTEIKDLPLLESRLPDAKIIGLMEKGIIMAITGSIAAIGVGLVTIGTGYGIGRLASSAMDGIARQPEAAPKIQVSMLIAAALIEGVALFAAVVCLLAK